MKNKIDDIIQNYDGKYDKIKPEKLSIGMAGKYISELKEIIN